MTRPFPLALDLAPGIISVVAVPRAVASRIVATMTIDPGSTSRSTPVTALARESPQPELPPSLGGSPMRRTGRDLPSSLRFVIPRHPSTAHIYRPVVVAHSSARLAAERRRTWRSMLHRP